MAIEMPVEPSEQQSAPPSGTTPRRATPAHPEPTGPPGPSRTHDPRRPHHPLSGHHPPGHPPSGRDTPDHRLPFGDQPADHHLHPTDRAPNHQTSPGHQTPTHHRRPPGHPAAVDHHPRHTTTAPTAATTGTAPVAAVPGTSATAATTTGATSVAATTGAGPGTASPGATATAATTGAVPITATLGTSATAAATGAAPVAAAPATTATAAATGAAPVSTTPAATATAAAVTGAGPGTASPGATAISAAATGIPSASATPADRAASWAGAFRTQVTATDPSTASPSAADDPPTVVLPGISPPASRPPRTGLVARYRSDVLASLVVFLVALPLCIGIAVASGVTPEAAIITAIVGGLVTGVMPGSSVQVSGPAAGLAVLVFDAVQTHGTATLGMIVLASGVLQILMGLAKVGTWFQAMATSVVAGMLAGIGLLILLGQAYALADRKAPGDAVHNLLGLPALLHEVTGDPPARAAFLLGVCGLLLMAFWGRAPRALRVVPGPLAAVLVVAALAAFFDADVRMLTVGALLDAVHLPTPESVGALLSPAALGTALVFALIASAEGLFGATAIDRMHNGPKTRYNKELVAQGTGNVVSGFLGGIPLTAVVVRSAANVHAGARTKLSRVLHGVWMLAFAVLAPGVLRLVPVTVLAAILVFSGWKLLNPRQVPRLWRHDRGEAAVLVVTTCAILATDLLEGVVIGLVAALFKLAWQLSRLTVAREAAPDGGVALVLGGSATFLTVPKLQTALDDVRGDVVHLDLTSLAHLDRTCRGVVDDWARQRGKEGAKVTTALPPGAREQPRHDGAH